MFVFLRCDYLKISNANNQTIGRYCGLRTGQRLSAIGGNYAVISFHSDGSVRTRGYRLLFSYSHLGKFCVNACICILSLSILKY